MTTDQEALLKNAQKSLGAAKVLLEDESYEAPFRGPITQCPIWPQPLSKGRTFSKHGSLLGAFGLHFIKSGEVEQKFHRYLIDYTLRRG